MIKSFKHKGLEAFYTSGSKAGIQAQHAEKLRVQLTALDSAISADDLRAPAGWRLHSLSGKLQVNYTLTVNRNWRVIFRFDGNDVELVDYLDYH